MYLTSFPSTINSLPRTLLVHNRLHLLLIGTQATAVKLILKDGGSSLFSSESFFFCSKFVSTYETLSFIVSGKIL